MESHTTENAERITVERVINISPGEIFALLSDPGRHAEIDGSGMLRGLISGPRPLGRVGDSFIMSMHQDGIGNYQMRNNITRFEKDYAIEWAPRIYPPGALRHVLGDLDPSGHTYGWTLDKVPAEGTRITHVYDWSGVRDVAALTLYPLISREDMQASLDRLTDVLGVA